MPPGPLMVYVGYKPPPRWGADDPGPCLLSGGKLAINNGKWAEEKRDPRGLSCL